MNKLSHTFFPPSSGVVVCFSSFPVRTNTQHFFPVFCDILTLIRVLLFAHIYMWNWNCCEEFLFFHRCFFQACCCFCYLELTGKHAKRGVKFVCVFVCEAVEWHFILNVTFLHANPSPYSQKFVVVFFLFLLAHFPSANSLQARPMRRCASVTWASRKWGKA